jgi:hypothetical protein
MESIETSFPSMSLAANSYNLFAFFQSFEAILIVINWKDRKVFKDKIFFDFEMNAVLTAT